MSCSSNNPSRCNMLESGSPGLPWVPSNQCSCSLGAECQRKSSCFFIITNTLLPSTHWIDCNHMTISNCKGNWEMPFICVLLRQEGRGPPSFYTHLPSQLSSPCKLYLQCPSVLNASHFTRIFTSCGLSCRIHSPNLVIS